MRILRAQVQSSSADDPSHRVRLSCESLFTNLLVESVNGLYLRPGDQVFVSVQDDFTQPLILGRCSGQLEIQNLVDIINGLVDVINKNVDTFNSHVHNVSFSGASSPTPIPGSQVQATLVAGSVPVTGPITINGDVATTTPKQEKASKTKPDELLK